MFFRIKELSLSGNCHAGRISRAHFLQNYAFLWVTALPEVKMLVDIFCCCCCVLSRLSFPVAITSLEIQSEDAGFQGGFGCDLFLSSVIWPVKHDAKCNVSGCCFFFFESMKNLAAYSTGDWLYRCYHFYFSDFHYLQYLEKNKNLEAAESNLLNNIKGDDLYI